MTYVFGPDRDGAFTFGGDPLRRAVRSRAEEVLADASGRGLESIDESLPVEAAVACGYCHLFTGEPPPTPFPERLAVPAAEGLRALLEECIADADSLPNRWDTAPAERANAMVADLLEARMDSWAALETLLAAAEAPGVADATEAVERSVGRFDNVLARRTDFLATLAHTQLLANWRLSLADPYRHPYPWWLAGTLEATSVEVDRSIVSRERSLLGLNGRAEVEKSRSRLESIRDRIVPAFSLAADVPPTGATLAPLLTWRSPDGHFTARVLPPPGGPRWAGRLVVEFLPASEEAEMSRLRGCVAVVAGRGLPIEWRAIDAEETAMVDVPVAAMLDALSTGDAEAAGLVVMPDGGEWRVVTASDEPHADR